jgi:hypothetical protein
VLSYDTGETFVYGVVDTSEQFLGGVLDTGDNLGYLVISE